MDRIDKFLNRRKQKTKRVIKSNNKYYEITKEDIKMIRSYKKNACLDTSVDMYIPYDLSFSRKTQDAPLEFVANPAIRTNDEKRSRKFVKKNDYIKNQKVPKNIIEDVWTDNLSDYEQNIILDISDQYTGHLEDLKMSKDDLEKELRTTYLRQYLPRERKTLKISDIIKNTIIPENVSRPGIISKFYNITGKVFLNDTADLIGVANENKLEIYERKNFYKIFETELSGHICKLKLDDTIKILCSLEDNNTVLYELDTKSKLISCISEVKDIIDFSCDKYKVLITNKFVKLIGTNETLSLSKMDRLTGVRTIGDFLFISTVSSFKVFNLRKRSLIVDCKIFSYIVDFTVYDNLVFLINNLRKIIIYDYERNVVIYTMCQDCDVLKISYNSVHSLLSVLTENNILIFYVNLSTNQFSLINKIDTKHESIQFDKSMPWIYAKKGDKLLLYT